MVRAIAAAVLRRDAVHGNAAVPVSSCWSCCLHLLELAVMTAAAASSFLLGGGLGLGNLSVACFRPAGRVCWITSGFSLCWLGHLGTGLRRAARDCSFGRELPSPVIVNGTATARATASTRGQAPSPEPAQVCVSESGWFESGSEQHQ